MRWDWRGLAILVVCVVVAGLIGSLVPDWLPAYRAVRPDSDGVARTATLDAWLIDAYYTDEILGTYGDLHHSDEIYVVVELGARPHRETAILDVRVITADGLTYQPVYQDGIFPAVHVQVGQQALAMQVFEVPRDRLDGLTLTVGELGMPGVQPVPRQPEFKLPNPLPEASSAVEMTEPVFEAAR